MSEKIYDGESQQRQGRYGSRRGPFNSAAR